MTRRLKIESLESRQMLSADIAIYRNGILATDDSPEEFLSGMTAAQSALASEAAEMRPLLTTAGNPSNYETPPGGAYGGVVRINITHQSGNYTGSGSLLPTGKHVLTAAHLFVDPMFGTYPCKYR
jgi:hypothetical protein